MAKPFKTDAIRTKCRRQLHAIAIQRTEKRHGHSLSNALIFPYIALENKSTTELTTVYQCQHAG